MSSGVPQGSILSPLPFLIDINDMSQAAKLFLYTDDTYLVCQHNDFNKIEKRLNEDLKAFVTGLSKLSIDKLSIHFGEDKTKSITFCD